MVQLRPYRLEDFDVVRRWIDDPATLGPEPFRQPRRSNADVRRLVSGDGEPGMARFAVVVDDRLVGEVQYRHGERGLPPGVFEIGIAIWDPADRGKGYGRDAQRQLVNRLFRDHGARRVQAGTSPQNDAERRCLGALGFVEEGTLRRLMDVENGRGDIVVYGLLKEEWNAWT